MCVAVCGYITNNKYGSLVLKQRRSIFLKPFLLNNNCPRRFHNFVANAGRTDDEATLSVLWLIGGIEASDGCNAIHANVSCSVAAVVVVVVGGLVELGIFMSNGRADSENGIGESGEEDEGGKIERENG